MAEAKALPNANAWPAEGLPIDAACKRLGGSLWDDYERKQAAAARDLADLRKAARHKFVPVASLPDQARRLAEYRDAKAALITQVCGCVDELSAHPGSFIADRKHFPASAIGGLEFDLERGTASGEGWPPLYDVRVHRAGGEPLPAHEWLALAVTRLKTAPDCPKQVTDAARRLEPEMAEAFKRRECDAAWTWGSIKNVLGERGFWSRTRPPKS
jgi:hypothetical protein